MFVAKGLMGPQSLTIFPKGEKDKNVVYKFTIRPLALLLLIVLEH
jgi:hypothetical protein